MLDSIANVIGILTAAIVAVRFVWKHREAIRDKLNDWHYEVYCFVFRPGRRGRNAKATLDAVAVARIRMKHNPYSGEWETSRVDFDSK